MMQSLEDYLADYERFHTNRVNLITHYVGIPCILIAVIMLLNWFSIAFASAYSISFTWLAWIVVSYFYVRLSLKLGGLAALILLVLALVIWLLSGHAPTKTTLIIFLILFIGGWIALFVGHLYEKAKPAFFKNVIHLLTGPLFLLNELLKRFHLDTYFH